MKQLDTYGKILLINIKFILKQIKYNIYNLVKHYIFINKYKKIENLIILCIL